MIWLSFLPLALYLLILGIINRRSHPLLVPGTWDFAGVLFAASGFLLIGGPFLLSTLNDKWRLFLLLGPHSGTGADGDSLWLFGLVASLLYFAIVTLGAGLLIWRQRTVSVIYNIDLDAFEEALSSTCARLGLQVARTEATFSLQPRSGPVHEVTLGDPEKAPLSSAAPARSSEAKAQQLDTDYFAAMRHLTLRWGKAASPQRREFERELSKQLHETLVLPGDVGGWFTVLAFLLLTLVLVAGFVLVIYRFVHRI